MNRLQDIVSAVLAREGALVEPIEPDGIEVVAPADIQKKLSLPEWSRMGFGADMPPGAQRVTLESDWLDRLNALLGDRGTRLDLSLIRELGGRSSANIDRMLQHTMVLENATYRVAGIEQTQTAYLMFAFRFTAVSDEKREDILHLCLNESNEAAADHLIAPLRALVDGSGRSGAEVGRGDDTAPLWTGAHAARFARRALQPRIRERLRPFLAGMQRRMKRDMEQIHSYHADLFREARTRLKERQEKGDQPATDRFRLRLAAIEREYVAKANDLRRKYAMSVTVEARQVLRVAMPVARVKLALLRRKGTRPYHLDWNPLSKKIDTVPCEGCWGESQARLLCDDHLHLVCPQCHSPCPGCGKDWCRVCFPDRCPKCKRGL